MSAVDDEIILLMDSVGKSLRTDGNSGDLGWSRLVDIGLTAIDVTPGRSGLGFLLAAMIELGRCASGCPVLEAVLANMFASGMTQPNDRVALISAVGGRAMARSVVRVSDSQIDGKVNLVEGADQSDTFLVLLPDGHRIVAVDRHASGVRVVAVDALLPGLCQVEFQGTAVQECVSDQHAVADLLALWRFGLCARALGAAQQGFDLVVEYAGLRRQFGQTIGSFQAIQHKLADSHIALSACREQQLAVVAAYEGGGDWRRLAAASAIFAGHVLRKVALETQHCFGAIGFSEEHPCPSLFRRVHGDLARLGTLGELRIELGEQLISGGQGALMRMLYDDDQPTAAFRARVRSWLEANWTSEHAAHLCAQPFEDRNWDAAFMQRAGRDGWTGLSWPVSSGGMGASAIEQLVFSEEMICAGAPEHSLICPSKILAPAIIRHGSSALKELMLPALRAGEVTGCLGYSEPSSGSDLASLRTRAVLDGDHYVISGQKAWTTDGYRASHMILAARTHPVPDMRQKGISMFVVPMDAPGITVRPMTAMYGHKFCDTYLDDVRIPVKWRLGEENAGWRILNEALAAERISMGGFVTQVAHLFTGLLDHLAGYELGGDTRMLERIGLLAAEIVAARRLALASLRTSTSDEAPLVAAAMTKVFAGELSQRLTEAALELLGGDMLLGAGTPGAPIQGRMEQMLRTSIMYVVGGGSNEIQRTLIARRGLGLGGR